MITVQLAPGARTAAVPVQLLVAMLKYRVVRLPLPPAPGAGSVTPVIVTLALPAAAVLVSVTVPLAFAGYAVPAGKEISRRVVGVAATPDTPVPVRLTGEPVTAALLSAVILPSATETDALSTALLTLGPPGHDAIAALRSDMKTLVVSETDGQFRIKAKGIPVQPIE